MTQHSVSLRRLSGVGLAAAILALCIALGACSITAPSVLQPTATGTPSTPATTPSTTGTPQATASPTAVPAQASVVEVSSQIVSVGSDSTGTASASCASGNPLLGGGFIARTTSNDGMAPTDSYPSATSTWTVDVTTEAGAVQLTAIAVCLQANFTVTTQVAQATNGGPDTTVNCPSGAVLTGGGFRSGGGTNVASQPSGNGWKVSTAIPFGGSASPTAYTVCAT